MYSDAVECPKKILSKISSVYLPGGNESFEGGRTMGHDVVMFMGNVYGPWCE